jgi:hypothetical protein
MIVAGSKFGDGGMYRNNPIGCAIKEARGLGTIDCLVSVGTGAIVEPKHIPKLPGILAPIYSLYLSILHCYDPETVWYEIQDLYKHCAEKKLHRLNITLTSDQSAQLDDVTKMAQLKELTITHFDMDSHHLHSAANALLASLFYFELDAYPRFVAGEYHCSGYIFCKVLQEHEKLKEALTRRLLCFTVETNHPQLGNRRNGYSIGDRMIFEMKALEDDIHMLIIDRDSIHLEISGFPCTLQALIIAQGLLEQKPTGAKRKRMRTVHFVDSGIREAKRRRFK